MEQGNRYPIVMVTWADTHMSDGGWLELKDYDDDGECIQVPKTSTSHSGKRCAKAKASTQSISLLAWCVT